MHLVQNAADKRPVTVPAGLAGEGLAPACHLHGACMNTIRMLSVTLALSLAGVAPATFAAEQIAHFHPQGKQPSTFTLEVRNGV